MLLRNKKNALSRAGLVGLVVVTGLVSGFVATPARAANLQAAQGEEAARPFAGTWHWMFNGKSFSTMTLVRDGDRFTGTVTPSHISLANDGSLDMADPIPDAAPSEISEASFSGSVLHIKTRDGFAFSVTLTDSTHAAIKAAGAPPIMKPIMAEKTR